MDKFICINVAVALDSLIKAIDSMIKEADTLIKEEAETKTVKQKPFFLFNVDDVVSPKLLRRSAELIQERLDLANEMEGVERKETEYKSLSWLWRKLLIDYGASLPDFRDLPLDDIIGACSGIGYYNPHDCLIDLINFIFDKTKEEDSKFWSEPAEGSYPRGVLMFCLLLHVLHEHLKRLYDLLESAEHRPDKSVDTIRQEVLESLNKAKPHFSLDMPDEELLAILKGLKEASWKNNRLNDVGLVADDITDDEWLWALKGPAEGRPAAKRKLPWKAAYVCKTFVELFLDGNYKLAEKVFCYMDKNGTHDLCNLHLIKNNRRKDICDEKTGLIARIIKQAEVQRT